MRKEDRVIGGAGQNRHVSRNALVKRKGVAILVNWIPFGVPQISADYRVNRTMGRTLYGRPAVAIGGPGHSPKRDLDHVSIRVQTTLIGRRSQRPGHIQKLWKKKILLTEPRAMS
jgi:hypothetical protein